MATRPTTAYPGRAAAPTPDYPDGSSQNETASGAGDGTPYNLLRANEIFGMQQALTQLAGITPSGVPDTALVSEYVQALVELSQGRAREVQEGGGSVADAYVLEEKTAQQKARAYFIGQRLISSIAADNTGAATVNAFALGVKAIKLPDGTDPVAGDITGRVLLEYDGTNFVLLLSDLAGFVPALRLGTAASPPTANTVVNEAVCRGWINFNGTGVIAIRDSFNVSSIVDNGAGDYTINWDTDFANVDYSWTFGATNFGSTTDPIVWGSIGTAQTAASLSILTGSSSGGTAGDISHVLIQAFGAQ